MDDNKSDNSGIKAPPVSPKVSNDNDLDTHVESAREKRIKELSEEVTLRLKKVVAGKKNKKMQGEANELIREMKESIERKSHNILLDNIFEREMKASIDSAEKFLSRTISREEEKEEKEKKEAEEKEARERRARIHSLEEPESTKDNDSTKPEKGKQLEQSETNTSVSEPSTTVKRGGFGVPTPASSENVVQSEGKGQTIVSPKRVVPPGTTMRDRHASSRTNAHTEKPDSMPTKPRVDHSTNVIPNSAGIVNHSGKQINLVPGEKPRRKMGAEPPLRIQLPRGMGIRNPIPFRAPSTSYETIEDQYETTDDRPFGNTRSDQPSESAYTSRGDAIGGGSTAGSMGASSGGGGGGTNGGGSTSGGGNGGSGGGGGSPRGRNPHIKRGGLGNRKAGHKSSMEKLEKNLEKKIRNEAIKRAASSLFLNPYFWAVVGIILLILLIIAILTHHKSGTQENPLKVMKTGPTQAKLNDILVYNITVTYPGSADDVSISDPLPQGTTYVSSNPSGTLTGTTVTWDAKTLNLPLTNPISIAVTLTLKATQDNLKIGNVASATVTGGTAGSGGGAGYTTPSAENCSGKYTLTNPTGKNFGDPACDFDKNKLHDQLVAADPANAEVWFNKVIPCESGFNPNAYAGPQTGTPDARGAWGLFQMGSASPPGSPPPAPGKNGINDRGDVPWAIQADNATTYGKKLSSLGAYWACAR